MAVERVGRGRDGVEDLLGDPDRLRRLGLWQQRRELVAADAAEDVRPPQTGAEALGDSDQQAIPDVMAEAVVDVLEVVEVEQQHRPGMVVALGVGDAPFDLLAKAPAVGEAGHLVVIGEEDESLLELLALADVLDLGDEVEGLAVGAASQRDAEQDPDDVAVAMEVALLHLVVAQLAGEHLADVLEVEVEVLGVGDLLEGLRDELVRAVAGELAQGAVDAYEVALQARRARSRSARARTPAENAPRPRAAAGHRAVVSTCPPYARFIGRSTT